MSDIRQFLRYEIPGYILFIYTFLLILPFINPSKIASLLPELLRISISGFIIAIPIGWLLYQIFNEHFIKMHYSKKSVKLIKEWSNEKYLSLSNCCCGELLNVGLYSSNNDVKNNEISFDSQLATETLRGYWTNYEARWIVAIPIPVISLLLACIILLTMCIFEVNPSIFLCELDNSLKSGFIFSIILIISYLINEPTDRIIDEINSLEWLFVLLREKQIKGTMDKIYKEKNQFKIHNTGKRDDT